MVAPAGLEPASPIQASDFKSDVYANSTTGPKSARVGAQNLSFGLVFYILSNPAVFAFVEKNFPFKVQKDMQLVFHTVLFMLFMYFGTKFFFDPVLGRVMEGYRNKAKKPVRKVAPKRR